MNSLDYKENVTISLTVFIVESVGSIEGTEEDDEPAGDRGADWKTSTGTEKNYLFFVSLFVCLFVFSSNAGKLGFHGSKRKRESIKTFFSPCAFTFYVNRFYSEDTGLKKLTACPQSFGL